MRPQPGTVCELVRSECSSVRTRPSRAMIAVSFPNRNVVANDRIARRSSGLANPLAEAIEESHFGCRQRTLAAPAGARPLLIAWPADAQARAGPRCASAACGRDSANRQTPRSRDDQSDRRSLALTMNLRGRCRRGSMLRTGRACSADPCRGGDRSGSR